MHAGVHVRKRPINRHSLPNGPTQEIGGRGGTGPNLLGCGMGPCGFLWGGESQQRQVLGHALRSLGGLSHSDLSSLQCIEITLP